MRPWCGDLTLHLVELTLKSSNIEPNQNRLCSKADENVGDWAINVHVYIPNATIRVSTDTES